MFIGQFIWKNIKGIGFIKNPKSFTIANHNYDIILWYGNQFVYEEAKFDFPKQDEKGKYRITTSGGWKYKDKERLIKRYGDRLVYTKAGEIAGTKIYEGNKSYIGIRCLLDDLGGNNKIYPTAKPYKLLRRIISLSTK